MRVIVVGGGIGGLSLAQGLRRRGVDVVVLERDTEVLATGGYRLHLDPQACAVLQHVLTTDRWDRLVEVSAGPEAFEAMHVVDRRLRVLARIPAGAGEHRLVGRRELRQVLAAELEESLVLDTRVTGWTRLEDGRVEVEAGVRSWVGDLVVAADGVGSVVAERAAGRRTSVPLDLVGLAGRVSGLSPWDDGAPSYLSEGPALAVGPGGVGLFLTRHAVPTPLEPPGWVWGLILSRPAAAEARTTTAQALEKLAGWLPWVTDLVGATPPDAVGHYRFHAADPDREMFAWAPGAVTALGDAVHAMPPTGGQSASTAIADAGDLLTALDRVAGGRTALAAAIATYQQTVSDRARGRVRESLGPARWVTRTRGPLGGALLTGATGLVRAGRILTRTDAA